jgi:hypothetical protein
MARQTVIPAARRNTVDRSAAVKAHHDKRRINAPIALTGIGAGKLINITLGMYGLLDVDPSYQRDEQSREITELITAIQNGGFIPDPVTLVRRQYGPEADRKRLWIIDGQQRTAAFTRLDREFPALVYEAASHDAERNFFLVMNERKAVSSNTFVHSWPGPLVDMIRAVDVQPDHPMCGRVLWGQGSGDRISATVMVRGLVMVAAGTRGSGRVRNLLSRADHAMKTDPSAKERCRTFLHLAPAVFPSYAPGLPMVALASVAYEMWTAPGVRPTLPTAKSVGYIRQINWRIIVPSNAARYLPVIETEIKKRWKY